MTNGKRILILALVGVGVLGVVLIASCAGFFLIGIRSATSANGEISTAIDDLMRAAANGSFQTTENQN